VALDSQRLIEQLQLACLDKRVAVSDLLRRAKLTATRLTQKLTVDWIESELSGYYKNPSDIPGYRKIRTELRGLNPVHGWTPIVIEDPKTAERLSTRPIDQPIGELESILSAPEASEFRVTIHDKVQKSLSESIADTAGLTLYRPEVAAFISRSSVAGMVDAVRNRVFDWSLALSGTSNVDLEVATRQLATEDRASAPDLILCASGYGLPPGNENALTAFVRSDGSPPAPLHLYIENRGQSAPSGGGLVQLWVPTALLDNALAHVSEWDDMARSETISGSKCRLFQTRFDRTIFPDTTERVAKFRLGKSIAGEYTIFYKLRTADAVHPAREALGQMRIIVRRTSEISEPTLDRLRAPSSDGSYDVFVCHASEDKDSFVRPLVRQLQLSNVTVWYDEDRIAFGDTSLREMNKGLKASRFGIAIFSPAFLRADGPKPYPDEEYHTLLRLELEQRSKKLLPIRYGGITRAQMIAYSEFLGNRREIDANEYGIERLVNEIVRVVRPESQRAIDQAESGDVDVVPPARATPYVIGQPGVPYDALPAQNYLSLFQPCLVVTFESPQKQGEMVTISWVVKNIGNGAARKVALFLPGLTIDELPVEVEKGTPGVRRTIRYDRAKAFRELIKWPAQTVVEFEDIAGNLYRQYAHINQPAVHGEDYNGYRVLELGMPYLVSERIVNRR